MGETDLDRLSFDDAEILKLESAAIAGHTCKVVLIEPLPGGGRPTIGALREHVAARLGRAPRCRQKVVFTPWRLARPAWVDDDDFEIDRHVVEAEVEGPLGPEGLRALAGELMGTRLSHERALWRLDLAPLEGGGTGIVCRIHHCMADGMTAMRMLGEILWSHQRQEEAPAFEPWSPAPAPEPGELARMALRERTAAVPAALGRTASGLGRAGRSIGPGRWSQAAGAAARLPGTIARELRPGGTDSVLAQEIGARREVAFAGLELAEMKAVGHSLEGHVTVNDVLLATVAGALREWLGAESEHLRVQVPVSLHHRDEGKDQLGNRDSFLNVDLPTEVADPLERLRRINAETEERKAHHDAEELYSFFHGLSHLRPAYRAGMRLAGGAREFSLSISNVPGPRDEIYVMGAPVSALRTVAEPAHRHALRASALSLGGRVQVGLCTDPDVLRDLAALAAGVENAFAELREAAGA